MEKKETPTLKSARTLRLTYNIPVSKTSKFWEGLNEGRVLASRCVKCGRMYFPPTGDCPHCLSSEVTWVPLEGEAELEAFTLITAKPASFAEDPPYLIGVGSFREGVKVFARVSKVELKDVRVGMKLRLTVERSREGRPVYTFIPLGREEKRS